MTGRVCIPEWLSVDSQDVVLGLNKWSVARLIHLARDLPVMEIPMSHLNVYYTYKNLTLRGMAMHFMAAFNADMSKPIILDEDGEVLDGRHRIMSALMCGQETILAVRFPENPVPCEVLDE